MIFKVKVFDKEIVVNTKNSALLDSWKHGDKERNVYLTSENDKHPKVMFSVESSFSDQLFSARAIGTLQGGCLRTC